MTATQAKPKSWLIPGVHIHPVALLYPPLPPEEFENLKASIVKNGLLVPIELWQKPNGDYWVIDGVQRLDALAALGEPTFRPGKNGKAEYIGRNPSIGRFSSAEVLDAALRIKAPEIIRAHNEHRRQLTFDQRAGIAAGIAKWMAEEGKERKQANLKRGDKKPETPEGSRATHRGRAAETAGKQMGVGATVVKQVLAADKAQPGAIEKLQKGEAKLAEVRERKPPWAKPKPAPVQEGEKFHIGPFSVMKVIFNKYEYAMKIAAALVQDGAEGGNLTLEEKCLLAIFVEFIDTYEDEFKAGDFNGPRAVQP